MEERFDAGLTASSCERVRTFINGRQCIEDSVKVAKWSRGLRQLANSIAWDVALRTFTRLAAGDKDLLGVVANVGGEYGMTTTDQTITTDKLHAANTGRCQGGEDPGHTCM